MLQEKGFFSFTIVRFLRNMIASQPFGLVRRPVICFAEVERVSIDQFTSTAEGRDVPEEQPVSADANLSVSWTDITPEPNIQIPDVLRNLTNSGVQCKSVPFQSAKKKPGLVKDRSVYFAVDTIITSQVILKAFDNAGIDIDDITSIQRKALNKTWIVTFDSTCEGDGVGSCKHRHCWFNHFSW